MDYSIYVWHVQISVHRSFKDGKLNVGTVREGKDLFIFPSILLYL